MRAAFRQQKWLISVFSATCLIAVAPCRADDAAQFTNVLPLVAQAHAEAKAWHDDAQLILVDVGADADATLRLDRIIGQLEGDFLLATFYSPSAAEQREYVLQSDGAWRALKPAPRPGGEKVLPVADDAFDLEESVKMTAGSNFKLPPFDDRHFLRATLQTTWNAIDRSYGPEWLLQAVEVDDAGLETTLGRMTVIASTENKTLPNEMTERTVRDHVLRQFPLGEVAADPEMAKHVQLSPDMRHVCYVVGGKLSEPGQFVGSQDRTTHVVWDGVAGPPFDVLMLSTHMTATGTELFPMFSKAGGHLLYAAQRERQWYMVVDGRPLPVGAAPRDGSVEVITEMTFSPDGSRWGCVVDRAKYEGEKLAFIDEQLYVDGKRYGDPVHLVPKNADAKDAFAGLGRVSHLVFSPDGSRLAYITGRDGKECVVVGGVPGPDFDLIHCPENSDSRFRAMLPFENLQFTPDGKDVLYVAKQDGKYHVARNGQLGRGFDKPIQIFAVSPDGQRVAYADGYFDEYSIYVDGGAKTPQVGPFFESEYFEFSADGRRFAYLAHKDEDYSSTWWVVDGVPGPPYEELSPPLFSQDGKHVTFTAKKEEYVNLYLVRDGAETLTRYGFSPAGEAISAKDEIAYIGSEIEAPELKLLVRGAEEPAAGGSIRKVTFSPDGSSLACVVEYEDELTDWVYLDYETVPDFPFADQSGFHNNELIFDGPAKLHYISVLDGKISCIEFEAVKP